MKLLPPKVVGVSELGAAVAFLVSSRSARAAPAPDGGEVPTPPMLRAGREKFGSSFRKAIGQIT